MNKEKKKLFGRATIVFSVFALLIWLLTSCMTVGRIERNCDKFAQICITDSETKTEIEYRDTTIYLTDSVLVPLPYTDTVIIRETLEVKNNEANLQPVHKEFGIIGVDASVVRSVLHIDAYLTDSSILHVEKDTVLVEKAIKEEKTSTTNTVVVTEKYIPGFYKFCMYWFIFSVLLISIWILQKLKVIPL